MDLHQSENCFILARVKSVPALPSHVRASVPLFLVLIFQDPSIQI